MPSDERKRNMRLGALFGAISGAAVAAVLYFVAAPNLTFIILVPLGAIMGAAQMHLKQT